MLCVADATIIYSEATNQSSAFTEEMIIDASLTCQNDDSTVTGLLDTYGGRLMSPIDLCQIHSVLPCLILLALIPGWLKPVAVVPCILTAMAVCIMLQIRVVY